MLGQELAIKSALNYRRLKKKGVTIGKTIDIIICTFCLHNHYLLLHDDRDFEQLENHLQLKVVKI